MESTAQPRVKICCISSVEEGRLAIRYGAAALGLVSEMPSGPGVIPERLICEITGRIRESVRVSVYLAGGLRPENVAEAIEIVRPFGLDVCNGVRTDGRLDDGKLAAFFQAVRATAQQHLAADARHAARR